MHKNNKYKVKFKERFRYEFDNLMAKGPIALVMLLFAITLLVVVIAGILISLTNKDTTSFIEAVWLSFMHTLDAGNLAGDDGGFFYILIMTLATVCGLFITSILIGIISTGIETKMESLRKGHSRILDKNHTVILGFNDNIYVMISELIRANFNVRHPVIVVMDDVLEKEDMEDLIRKNIKEFYNTKIICRKGSISDFSDLNVCALENSKSIIINSDDDFKTIKSILSATSILKENNNKATYITAVICQKDNISAATIAGEGRAEIIYFEDVIARIIVNTSRMTGYSDVYTELLKYEGDEIYVESIKNIAGIRMKDINLYFPKSQIIGLKKDEEIILNPDSAMVARKNDKLVLIAMDDGISNVSNKMAKYAKDMIKHDHKILSSPKQRILILRYGPRLNFLLEEFDEYLAKGSEIIVAAKHEYNHEFSTLINKEYKNISVKTVLEDIYVKDKLNNLLALEPDSVLVLNGYHDDSEKDDSKSLLVLLQLRSLSDEYGYNFNITSEIREVRNKKISEITHVRNFVVSSNIISLMVTKISQTRELNQIYNEILSKEGSEIYMWPAEHYVELNCPINGYTASMAAASKHQVFLGYRHSDVKTGEYQVFLNPCKSEDVVFNKDDYFIVLAED